MLPYYFQIPLGVILAIVDPVVIAVSKSGPTVIAGKSIVLKPRTQVFMSLIIIIEVFADISAFDKVVASR